MEECGEREEQVTGHAEFAKNVFCTEIVALLRTV